MGMGERLHSLTQMVEQIARMERETEAEIREQAVQRFRYSVEAVIPNHEEPGEEQPAT